jgi:hypothetical protein
MKTVITTFIITSFMIFALLLAPLAKAAEHVSCRHAEYSNYYP